VGKVDNEQLLEMFFNKMRLKGLSQNSINGYKHDLHLMLKSINKNILNIEYKDLNLYFLSMAGNKASKTIGRKMAACRSLYRFLLREDIIEKDPTIKLESPKLGKSLPKFLDDKEVEQYFSVIKSKRDRTLIFMLFVTGMRLNELFQLNRNSIQWDEKRIVVHGKGNKDRVVLFNDEMKDMLKDYLDNRKDTNEALFVSRDNLRLGKRQIEKMVSRYGKLAGLNKKVTPHSWRHTLFTKLLRNKVPLKEISTLAGHSSTSVTEIYARLDLDTVAKSYDNVMNKK
jgi:integrase/recombinase XerD